MGIEAHRAQVDPQVGDPGLVAASGSSNSNSHNGGGGGGGGSVAEIRELVGQLSRALPKAEKQP